MKMNDLAAAAALSDQDLLARLASLAGSERHASAALVVHLAALDARPALYAALGFGSLFAYCTGALRLSEDATCSRIEAARACRRFPVILDGLASGALTLTAIRMVGGHLTPENHEAVLARVSGRTCREIEKLVAELAPRPDAASMVRRLPHPANAAPAATTTPTPTVADEPRPSSSPAVSSAAPMPFVRESRPVVQATSPERYRVQFTIGEETHARLRRLQTLLRREIPSGDPAVILDRAVALLLEHVEKKKLAAVARPRTRRRIRRETDGSLAAMPAHVAAGLRTPIIDSRDIPDAVRREVWRRDGGQCAYVATTGRRCGERAFLELHHLEAYANGGPPTVENIALRCRRHNQYEAELVFGPRRPRTSSRPPVESPAQCRTCRRARRLCARVGPALSSTARPWRRSRARATARPREPPSH
jgi:hypothetical protein